jgi:hypothetical protein
MKQYYKSKVVWLNILALIIGIAPIIAENLKLIEPGWALMIDSILSLVVGVANVVLRVWFTDVPIDTPGARSKLASRRMDNLS